MDTTHPVVTPLADAEKALKLLRERSNELAKKTQEGVLLNKITHIGKCKQDDGSSKIICWLGGHDAIFRISDDETCEKIIAWWFYACGSHTPAFLVFDKDGQVRIEQLECVQIVKKTYSL